MPVAALLAMGPWFPARVVASAPSPVGSVFASPTVTAAPRPANRQEAAAGNRIHLARYELRGPLRRVEFEAPASAPEPSTPTRVLLELAPGESRVLEVPFAAPLVAGAPEARGLEPGVSENPNDTPRVLPLGTVAAEEREAAWRALSPGLRARSGPPVASPVGSIRPADLAWLLACAGLVLGFRRKPWLALGFGILGAGGTLLLRRALPVTGAPGVTVVDVDLAAGQALRTDGGAGQLVLPAGIVPLRVTSQPRGADLGWTVEPAPGGGTRLACAVTGTVRARTPVAGPPPGSLGREQPPWRPMAEVWTRTPDGTWSGHGAWSDPGAGGEPVGLPPVRDPGGMPPGWLASGLPPGRGVLVGRLAGPGALVGELEALGEGCAVWIRATGFE